MIHASPKSSSAGRSIASSGRRRQRRRTTSCQAAADGASELVSRREPLHECAAARGSSGRPQRPEMARRRERRLVDEIPDELASGRHPAGERRQQRALPVERAGIEVRIAAAEVLRHEREHAEDDGQPVLARGQVERFERAHDAFVHHVRVDADLAPAGPDTGADRVHAERRDLAERLVPHRRVRLEQEIAMHRRRHRRRADDRFGAAAAAKRVAVERELRRPRRKGPRRRPRSPSWPAPARSVSTVTR